MEFLSRLLKCPWYGTVQQQQLRTNGRIITQRTSIHASVSNERILNGKRNPTSGGSLKVWYVLVQDKEKRQGANS